MRYVNHSNVGFCPLKRPFSYLSMVVDRQKDTNTQNDYHNPTMRGPH